MSEDPALTAFLKQVDEVGSIIKDLKSEDTEKHDEAITRADNFLESVQKKEKRDNTGFNRTVVNKDAYRDHGPNHGPTLQQNMSQDDFYAAMERDAQERHERKQRNVCEATKLKDQGNLFYKEGNYEKAIELYSEGLLLVKDLRCLYTNRAQAYIQIKEYEKAIEDCEWALKVYPNCVKAYVHKGKALVALQQFDEAVACFEEAEKCDPSKQRALAENDRYLQKKIMGCIQTLSWCSSIAD